MVRKLCCIAVAGGLLACSDTEQSAGGGAPDVPSGGDGAGAIDVPADVPVQPDVAPPPADVPGDDLPPGFGDPCSGAQDCPSGWCVDGLCTVTCMDECPNGWSCKSLQNAGPDVIFLCVADAAVLCDTCAEDADCPLAGARCVPIGAEGTFCAVPCDQGAPCPGGSSCQSVDGAELCLPVSGSCTCDASNAGATRACAVGQCSGTETCQGDQGWSGCSAPEPQPEACNGADDDCDGVVDPEGSTGCKELAPDVDGDGFGQAGQVKCLCAPDGAWKAEQGGDCDDLSAVAHPGASELCNGKDDDCDGAGDVEGAEGCVQYAVDADGDGWGVVGDAKCLCAPAAPYTTLVIGDCADGDKAVHPSAEEQCDGADDDCDGETDEGAGGKVCEVEGGDSKCPGVTACQDGQLTCVGKAPAPEECNGADDDCDGTVDEGTGGGPCTTTNELGSCAGTWTCAGAAGLVCSAKVPAAETCNGADDDCDGTVDPAGAFGCATYYADADADGWGASGDVSCLCVPAPPYTALLDGDCDDGAKATHPEAVEGCNGGDDDCDGETDEGTGGLPCKVTNEQGICSGVTSCIEGGIQCIGKAPGPEACNGVDDDCDGTVDPPNAAGCTTFYADTDGDGWGQVTDSRCLCAPTAPWLALKAGDCDDAASATHPQALEQCNAADDDCDGQADEGTGGLPCKVTNALGACPGVTACQEGQIACDGPQAAPEQCNGLDDDCDGQVDEGTGGTTCTVTNALGTCTGKEVCLGAEGLACTAVAPAPEACNGLDDDCDGQVDEEGAEGCLVYHADGDKDGFGSEVALACLCKPTAAYSTLVGGDCDDASKQSYPGAAEVCDGGDNNCNGTADDAGAQGCTTYLKDGDGDGYGVGVSGKCLCQPDALYKAELSGDCDDANADRHPDAVESCDGKDQNCNAVADETCDQDGDGWCAIGAVVVGTPAACKNGVNDCDDAAFSVHPKAAESCDELDNNCNGAVDEGVQSPCGGCALVCTLPVGAGEASGFSSDPAAYNGTGLSPDGFVQLDAQSVQLRTLWVANSGQGTVSKIDTTTGKETARYTICSDPSRTSVASDGSVWVGCRGDGKVAHVALDLEECVDKNGNGVIETSKDGNGNGVIDGAEMLAAGSDECVLLVAQPDGATIARAMAVDKNDDVWVGFWNTARVRKIDKLTGASLLSIELAASGGRPYGLALDQKGDAWVALRDSGHLGYIDASSATPTGKWWNMPNGYNVYGIAVDQNGEVWIAGAEHKQVVNFDPKTQQFTVVSPLADYGFVRGIAASLDGKVYAAHYSWDSSCANPAVARKVTVIDATTKQAIGAIDLANAAGNIKGTVGVSIDFEGYLWAVNYCSSTAEKIDTKTGAVVLEAKTGPNPYTYSDMTGFALKTVVAPVGSYVQVFEGWPTGTTKWLSIDLDVTLPDKTSAELRYRTAATQAGLQTAVWSPTFGPFPPEALPLEIPSWAPAEGRFLAVEVKLKSLEKKVSPQLEKIVVVGSGG